MPTQNPFDSVLVADLISRERAARDASLWPDMLACWHSNSHVDISWFQGTGPDFVAASRHNESGNQTLSFHQMSPSVVTVRGDRAIADTGAAIHAMRFLGEVEVEVVSHTRLLFRALRQGDTWLLAGLRMIYIRDLLIPRDPTRLPVIDPSVLQEFRTSYRYLSFILTQSGHVPRTDLPGIDKPETVTALRAEERQWLETES